MIRPIHHVIAVLLTLGFVAALEAQPAEPKVDFASQVQPVLSKFCYACHGPDKQKSGLRFDQREAALKPAESDELAIVPGNPDASRMLKVLDGRDKELSMPPKGNKPSAQQVALIRQWIAQGAEYNLHWSFVPPRRPALPQVKNAKLHGWPRNAIDHFILARLEQEGLEPSPEADPYTLVRRVYLDLIGIPPTPEEADAFVKEVETGDRRQETGGRAPVLPTSDAYERLVDRLLASPHYGERWARKWLDLARYADTNGYEKDRTRSIWPYRDWVIKAINEDMPFDQFTIDQIAGDMIQERAYGKVEDEHLKPEERTRWMGIGPAPFSPLIATGFHRNTMTNEEGGIDVEEFRFHSVVDRVNTTSAVWLGLTVGCAQCHNHKYDPISQKEYYRLFALLNNADEPEISIESSEARQQMTEYNKKWWAMHWSMGSKFPAKLPEGLEWSVIKPGAFQSKAGVKGTILEDHSIRIDPGREVKDIYTVKAWVDLLDIAALKIEALPDPSLPKTGPGLAANGNFVISEVTVSSEQRLLEDAKDEPVGIARAEADVSQKGFDISAAIDGDETTGWAIDDGSGKINQARAAVLHFTKPIVPQWNPKWQRPEGAIVTIKISQQHGAQHMLGRFRLHAGRRTALPVDPKLNENDQRGKQIDFQFHRWIDSQKSAARHWEPLIPTKMSGTNGGTFTASSATVYVTGDNPNQNVYTIETSTFEKQIRAIRLEVYANPYQINKGPGRAPLFSEGDFHLGEFEMQIAPRDPQEPFKPVAFADASHSYAQQGRSAKLAIDGDPDTAWSIKGGTGKNQQAVFIVKDPPPADKRGFRIVIKLDQRYIHQMTIGTFRLSVLADQKPEPPKASLLPTQWEEMIAGAEWRGHPDVEQHFKDFFLRTTPLLAESQREFDKLEASRPRASTTMVMQERDIQHPRTTRIHKRGEFLQPGDPVTPGVPAVLHPLYTRGPKADRLDFARWLVDAKNPLVGRVVMNRQWHAFFGRGLVRTTEDFGLQGERPSHPDLLDWLAVEFAEGSSEFRVPGSELKGTKTESSASERKTRNPEPGTRNSSAWSMKHMHKLIVMSATYRQSSRITPGLLERDPTNVLLARGPRFRVEAEVIRDSALAASGLLSRRIGGPSVFPPQPDGVNTLSYGGFNWVTATGENRYRRGLYTFAKRTTPYAAFIAFDGPTGDTCLVRRDRSNTPLQALTMMNDTVFVEAAQALAKRVLTLTPLPPREGLGEGRPINDGNATDDRTRATRLFRLVLTREPTRDELAALTAFVARQRERLAKGELDAGKITGGEATGADLKELAAWTTAARGVMNLDEAVTKE